MSNIYRKQGVNTGGGGGSIDTSALANKTDLTAIILTGTTNTSGGTISAGTWFYLNGKPCIAKVDIASNATFTKDTNYEEKTVGSALSELNSKITLDIINDYVQSSPFSLAQNTQATISISCGKVGYNPIGVLGVMQSSASHLQIESFFYEGSGIAKVTVYNRDSAVSDIVIGMTILYRKVY